LWARARHFATGQILRLVSDGSIANQEELRRGWLLSGYALRRPRFHATFRSCADQDTTGIQIRFSRGEGATPLPAHWLAHLANFFWISGRRKTFWC